MYVVCGLGNPGKRYANTRHNLGFITIDRLAEKLGVDVKRVKFKALVAEARVGACAEKVILVKPQTYMNLSGESVREVVDFYKVEPDHLIVVYDDLDLDVGRIRIRPQGSAGTHRGMQSVIYQLGFDNFPRIRIGIGDRGVMDIKDYVTGGFSKEEVGPLEDAVDRAVGAILTIIENGTAAAMNQYNGSGK